MGHSEHFVVDDADVVLTDRAHGELRLERYAELSNHDHIERNVQGRGDLGRDRHAAAGESDHHDVGDAAEVSQPVGQHSATISPVDKHHLRTP